MAATITFNNQSDIGISFLTHRNISMNIMSKAAAVMELDPSLDQEDGSFYVAFYNRTAATLNEALELGGTFTVSFNIPSDWGETATDMEGATSTKNGLHGLVPQPMAGDQDKFLSGSGVWKNVADAALADRVSSIEDVIPSNASSSNKVVTESDVSSAYHHAGTKTVAELTSSLLIASNEGNVYNITDNGKTTADFIEGAGKKIEEGANVGVAKVGNAYKFDLLSGFIDSSGFVNKSETKGLLKNDGSVDTITNIPAGGTAGQALIKKSNSDGDLEWGSAGKDVAIEYNGTASASAVRKQRIGIDSSYTDIYGTTYMETTINTSTSAAVNASFTNAAITADSVIDVYTSVAGLNYSSISVSSGSCVITYPIQATATSGVKVRIYIK